MEEWLDESLFFIETGIAQGDCKPAVAEARTLKYLHTTYGPSASIEQDVEIRESASKLSGALTEITTCGPEIRFLEVVGTCEQMAGKRSRTAQESNWGPHINIEQGDTELIAKAEELFREQVDVADLGQNEVIYILPYQHAGVWHCGLKMSDFILITSVSQDKKMRTIDPRHWTSCVYRLTYLQGVHKDLHSNMITGWRDNVRTLQIISILPAPTRRTGSPENELHPHNSSLGWNIVVHPPVVL